MNYSPKVVAPDGVNGASPSATRRSRSGLPRRFKELMPLRADALHDEEVVPLQPGTTTPELFEQTVFTGVTRLLYRFSAPTSH